MSRCIKVLGICGSPRKGGNTDVLIDKVLEGARASGAETLKLSISELNIAPCMECARPYNGRGCVLEDDMREVYKSVEDADVVVVGSPIFFGSISAQLKALIDRYQCYWMFEQAGGRDKGNVKKGVFISVSAGERNDFFENSRSIVKNFFATIGAEYSGEIFLAGVEKKGDVERLQDVLDKAYGLGSGICR